MQTEQIAKHYKHIDNGGITISIEDRGTTNGIHFVVDGQYYGYPCIQSSFRIDQLGGEWLREVGLMLIEASGKLDKIDWSARQVALDCQVMKEVIK